MQRLNPLTGKIEIFEKKDQTLPKEVSKRRLKLMRGGLGPVGPVGPIGKRGPKGEPGLRGKMGLVGPVGPQGFAGARGSRWFSGKGSPTKLQCKDGDFYLDKKSFDFYEYSGSEWSLSGNLKGSAGKDGIDQSVIHRTLRVPKNDLGKDGDWCFCLTGELFYKEKNRWFFYAQIGLPSSGGTTQVSSTTNDGFLPYQVIASGVSITVDVYRQMSIHGDFIVEGDLTLDGSLVILPDHNIFSNIQLGE